MTTVSLCQIGTMGSVDACAAVHQRIAYKSRSVHMDAVPVQPWAQSDTLRKPQDLQSLLAARQHQMALSTDADDVEVTAVSASSTSYVSVSLSLLLTSLQILL